MMRGSKARSSLPQGWSQTVESRINIGLDKERDFYKLQRIFDSVRQPSINIIITGFQLIVRAATASELTKCRVRVW